MSHLYIVFELKRVWVSKLYVELQIFGKWFPVGGRFQFGNGCGPRVRIGCTVRRGKSRQDLYEGFADLRKGICDFSERKQLSCRR